VTFLDFLSLKNDVNVPSKSNKQKNFLKNVIDPDHCLKEYSYRDLEDEEDESSESELELRSRRRDFFFLETILCKNKEKSCLTLILKYTEHRSFI
jgi:hypothetical protein